MLLCRPAMGALAAAGTMVQSCRDKTVGASNLNFKPLLLNLEGRTLTVDTRMPLEIAAHSVPSLKITESCPIARAEEQALVAAYTHELQVNKRPLSHYKLSSQLSRSSTLAELASMGLESPSLLFTSSSSGNPSFLGAIANLGLDLAVCTI